MFFIPIRQIFIHI